MHSDTNVIGRCAFLINLQAYKKIKNKVVFQARRTHCLSRQKVVAFKVKYYFYLQSNLSLLNLVLSSMKW